MALRYTQAKIFHFPAKVDSLPQAVDAIEPPLHVRIKPTNLCNHNCRYCAYRSDNLQLGQDMQPRDAIPRDKMFEIIEDLADMGVQAVTFSGGGEPFCYPHLAETLRRLVDTPLRFAALTNGARLEGESAELFAAHGTWLRVSIDGWDDASYAHYRRVPEGEFTRVLNNMAQFKTLRGTCTLGVSLIVDQANSSHVCELICRLRDVGVDSVKVSPCIVDNDGLRNNEYHRPFFAAVKDQVRRAIEACSSHECEIYDAYHELDAKFTKGYSWCPYLQILPVIAADCNVYSCQDKAYNAAGLLGSIRDMRFRDFWHADKEKFFRIDPSRHCRHHCVANGKNRLVLDYLNADREHLGFV